MPDNPAPAPSLPRIDPDRIRALIASVDIYVLDLVGRGLIASGSRVLDAGCGDGRNLRFLAEAGAEAWALDSSPGAIQNLARAASSWPTPISASRLLSRPIEAPGLLAELGGMRMDAIVCNAVLHFARDHDHFQAMLDSLWQALAPGGIFFARLATSIGIADVIRPTSDPGRYVLPDGSTRFLVDRDTLLAHTNRLNATLVDPLKTTLVDGARAMTTWTLRSPSKASQH